MKVRALAAIGSLFCGITAAAPAAVVSLDLQVNESAKTWDVFASIDGASDGLASFAVDVTGEAGLSVNGSTLSAPRPFDAGLDDFRGFRIFRSNGTNGIDIRASQDTVVGSAAVLLLELGVGSPVHLATGTYVGDAGTLTAEVHPGSLFNVFPDGFVAGGATAAADSVTADSVVVPEPAGLILCGVGAVLFLRRRRAAVL